MEDIIYYNELYDLYGILLTDKQKKYFEDYYFHNYSYSEMAEEYSVSRNAVFNQLHNVIKKLQEYEENLHLLDKKKKLLEVISLENDSKIKKMLEDII